MILFKSLATVRAGQAGAVIPTEVKVQWDLIKGYLPLDPNDKLLCVEGESMSPEDIHTGDILISHSIISTAELKYGDYIILHTSDDKNLDKLSLKLRKFLCVVDINKDAETLWNKVSQVDGNRGTELKKLFEAKLEKAQNRLSGEQKRETILSITYTEKGREYSFHSIGRLYAKVDAYINSQGEKKDL